MRHRDTSTSPLSSDEDTTEVTSELAQLIGADCAVYLRRSELHTLTNALAETCPAPSSSAGLLLRELQTALHPTVALVV